MIILLHHNQFHSTVFMMFDMICVITYSHICNDLFPHLLFNTTSISINPHAGYFIQNPLHNHRGWSVISQENAADHLFITWVIGAWTWWKLQMKSRLYWVTQIWKIVCIWLFEEKIFQNLLYHILLRHPYFQHDNIPFHAVMCYITPKRHFRFIRPCEITCRV